MNKSIGMPSFLILWLTMLLTHIGAWAEPVAPPSTARLLLTGSTTMAPLMLEVTKRFHALHPGIQIDVQMGGSGRGITDVRQGKADIGMVSRALGETEHDLYSMPIARDGVAVIVHKDNPVASLSDSQLLDLYTGKIANWRQLGGRDAPVLVLQASQEGGSSELISHYLRLPFEQIKAHRRIGPNAERIAAVAADPQAVIYVSLGEAERKAREGVPVKLLAIGGVVASSRNIRSGNYPLSRPLILVMRGTPTGMARTFFEYCVSSEITDLVRAFDFIPYLD